ncbi:MAG TPA: nuclear transport factor 2 family protein [Candidatus Binataceae bacterium]
MNVAAKSTEQMLAELADREAIRELPRLYCHYLWTKDPQKMANLFTEDATICIQGMEDYAITGRDKLAKVFQRVNARYASLPFIHNHIIELEGPDRANGYSYYEILESEGSRYLAAGYYRDQYRKIDGQWKFQYRKVHMATDFDRVPEK